MFQVFPMTIWVRIKALSAITASALLAGVAGGFLYGQSFTGDSIVSLPGRPGVYRLIGHVKIEHNGNRIFSDFADYDQKTGSCQAYDNLRIRTSDNIHITGEVLDYDGASGSYTVERNVVLKDREMTMKTPALRYEGSRNRAYYSQGGEMTSGQTVLTSEHGYYDGQAEIFHCFDNVVIVNPQYTIWTDTLHYAQTGLTHFQGNTNIETSDYYMYGRKGWFHQEENKVSLQRDAYVKTRTSQVLFGDSIYYDLGMKNGNVYRDVFLLDTARNCYIKSDYAENKESEGYALFTLHPRGVMVDHGDSLFVVGDTMVMTYDTVRKIKEMLVYHEVRFFKEGIQGKCDSLSYRHRDSLMELYREPIIWLEEYQIDGDTVKVWFTQNRPEKVLIQEKAFIVSEVSASQGYYNQVKGKYLWGYFDDSSRFEMAHVIGAVQSVYYVLDEAARELIGVNKTESRSLKMYFEDNQVRGINVIQPSSTTLYPVDRLSRRERILKGFHWKPELWPKSKYDLSTVW